MFLAHYLQQFLHLCWFDAHYISSLGKCFVCPISSESNDKVILKSLGFLQPILGYGNGKLLFYLFGVATQPIPNSSDCWENRNRILEPWQPAVGLHLQEKICQRQQVKTDSGFGLTSPCDLIIGFFCRETTPWWVYWCLLQIWGLIYFAHLCPY